MFRYFCLLVFQLDCFGLVLCYRSMWFVRIESVGCVVDGSWKGSVSESGRFWGRSLVCVFSKLESDYELHCVVCMPSCRLVECRYRKTSVACSCTLVAVVVRIRCFVCVDDLVVKS